MTAVEVEHAVTPQLLIRRAAVLSWFELPRVIAVGAVWIASLVPLAAAVLSGQWWLMAIASLPATLISTGMARFAVPLQRGDRARVRDILRTDPVLAVSISAAAALGGWLISTPAWQLFGFVVAAVLLVLTPYALAYGAVRGRRNLSPWRGAVILVGYRPSWALTLLAVSLLCAFLVVATVGALGLIIPVSLAVFATGVVGHLLDEIDAKVTT